VVGGGGPIVRRVAFAADGGFTLGVGTVAGKGDEPPPIVKSFRLDDAELKQLPVDRIVWRRSIDGAGDWSVAVTPNRRRLQLARGAARAGFIDLDPVVQGRAVCWCFLADAVGVPFAIAVGTDVQNAIFIHQLTAEGPAPLRRMFRDHADVVVSLGASPDGRWLASSSLDRTVKLWSLEGLRAIDGVFSAETIWGAVFEAKEQGAAVLATVPAGVAAHRGLRVGDRITRLRRASPADGKAVETIDDPRGVVAALASIPPWQTVVLSVSRDGQPLKEPILVVPGWEPVVSLYVDGRGEWAYWTPQGFYNASVDGDRLFGWQINRGPAERPDFFLADQFRDQLERPNVLRRLLEAGSLLEALRLAGVNDGKGDGDRIEGLAARVPKVTLTEPRDAASIPAGGVVRIVAEIEFPDAASVDRYEARATTNGYPAEQVLSERMGNRRRVEWRTTPPDAWNRVSVEVAGVDGDRETIRAGDAVLVHAAVDKPRRRLHLLTLAVGAYPAKELRLDFPVVDAKSLVETLSRRSGAFYELGEVRSLADGEVTRMGVEGAVDDLLRRLRSADQNDLLMVFVAGHGVAFGADYFLIPPVALPGDLNEETVRSVGIPWSEFRRLNGARCRKVFLLDTCYAGNVLEAESLDDAKARVRPLQRDQALVVSATDVNQSALEFTSFGHGAFTKVLLDALDGKADGSMRSAGEAVGVDARRDGSIDLAEAVRYVELEVPRLTARLQTPKTNPLDLLDLIDLPLVRVDAKP
ncbi:MAG: caspase family protein, partial [Planctomycetia bacterium]